MKGMPGMAIVLREIDARKWALDELNDDRPGVIARRAGLNERTVRRAFAGGRMSDATYLALRALGMPRDLFEIGAGNDDLTTAP